MNMKPGTILIILAIMIVIIIVVVNFLLKPAQQPASEQPKAFPTLGPVVQMTVQADTSTPFDAVGQTIQYRFDIKNAGNEALAGAVTVMGTDVTCPAVTTIGNLDNLLDPNETLSCTASHVVTQADLDAGSVTIVTTANINGKFSPQVTTTVPMVQPLQVTPEVTAAPPTIANSETVQSNSANFAPGTTIQHKVASGEWLWQITRCYGANLKQVIKANPQIADPDEISPNATVTVPNIGSDGPIYGPPCLTQHTVQADDTWDSIAKKYNADLAVLRRVNPVALTPGKVLVIPLNSANY